MDVFSIVRDFSTKQNYQVTHNNTNNNLQKINENNLNSNSENKEKEKIEKDKIIKALNELNEELQRALDTSLEFRFNDKVDELTVQVIDKKNNEVIREFPPKEALKLMEKMRELVGLLFDKKG